MIALKFVYSGQTNKIYTMISKFFFISSMGLSALLFLQGIW